MTELIADRLQKFRNEVIPYLKGMIQENQSITKAVIKQYEDIINTHDATPDEINILTGLRTANDQILYSITNAMDILSTIGRPAKTERYFNISNGEVLEVSREQFTGPLDQMLEDN